MCLFFFVYLFDFALSKSKVFCHSLYYTIPQKNYIIYTFQIMKNAMFYFSSIESQNMGIIFGRI